MKTPLRAAIAALLIASLSPAAHAQIMGDENTSVTGDVIYVEEDEVIYEDQARNYGQTISGAVGLPLNPTAQIPAVGETRIQVNYFELFDAGVSDAKIYGVYAATRVGETPLEISAGVEKLSSSNDVLDIERTGFVVGAKYLVVMDEEDPEAVRVAVGAGYSSALYKNAHVYAVASKSITTGQRVVTGHLGVRYDRFSIIDEDSSKVSLYGGLEVPVDSRGRFVVIGEAQSKNANDELGGKAPFSLALRYQNPSGFSATAGIARQGVISEFDDESNGGKIFVQLGTIF